MKKWQAGAIAVLLPCLAYVVVVILTDRVFWDTTVPPGKEHRAALAIRDNVSPFQKWGSKTFTWQYLNRYYDAAWYFTQSDSEDLEQEFLSCLDKALQHYPNVDLFLLAHGNQIINWVAKLPVERRRRIRLVYNTGCYDLPQGPQWLNLGARAYVGHPGKSASPVFYFFFLRRWSRGYTIQEALAEANGLMRLTLKRIEPFSFGELEATRINQQSKAFCYGERQLRLQDYQE